MIMAPCEHERHPKRSIEFTNWQSAKRKSRKGKEKCVPLPRKITFQIVSGYMRQKALKQFTLKDSSFVVSSVAKH